MADSVISPKTTRLLPTGFTALVAVLAASASLAATTVELEPANNDPDNINSLQRGARNFMNYCAGCHSAQYVRYNTLGKGLNLSEDS